SPRSSTSSCPTCATRSARDTGSWCRSTAPGSRSWSATRRRSWTSAARSSQTTRRRRSGSTGRRRCRRKPSPRRCRNVSSLNQFRPAEGAVGAEFGVDVPAAEHLLAAVVGQQQLLVSTEDDAHQFQARDEVLRRERNFFLAPRTVVDVQQLFR